MGYDIAASGVEKLLGDSASREGQIVCPLTPSQRQRLRDRYAVAQARSDDDVILLLDYLGWVERELLQVCQRSQEMEARLTRTFYGMRHAGTIQYSAALKSSASRLPHNFQNDLNQKFQER